MLPTFTSMVDGMLEESLKQSLAMSKFLFSGRRQPTPSSLSSTPNMCLLLFKEETFKNVSTPKSNQTVRWL
jgi:hypothetical protein